MPAIIKSTSQDSVTIEVTVPLSKSMLNCEEKITAALNEAGSLAAKTALEQFDTDGTPILIGDEKWTAKGKFKKPYQTTWGEIEVDRYTYQSSKGGKQFCPLEKDARIILTSTPGFAKLVSSKYAELGSSRVLFDLEQNHQRTIARSYLKNLCDAVGAVAQAKEETWTYTLPEMPAPVKTVAVGIDGTCMLLTESGWREAMVGTLSLYDGKGKRLHTIQMGATPEYGKNSFYTRFDRELEQIREQYPNACFIGIADGAKSNWEYLKPRTDKQTVDFWHAAGYLGKAADAMFVGKRKEASKREWLDNACHKLKHKVGAASRLLREMTEYSESSDLPNARQEKLHSAISYFTNNKDRMSYARNVENNIPIGSGVTEAACKTLIKQRLCNSGIRWKEKGAAAVISLRSLAHTDCRWNQFWGKVSQYGYPLAA
jgi:hypothetical protein